MRVPGTSTFATAVALVAVVASGVAGCSEDDAPVDTTPRESTEPASTAPTTPTTPATSEPASPEPTTPTSTPPASPPASENAMPQVCGVVTAQQMSDVLFFPVELTATGDGSCRFAVPGDDTAPAVEYVQTSGADAAALAEAKDSAVQRSAGRLQPVDDVGDDAFFAVGAGADGQVTGAGGVLVGTTLVQVVVTQRQDLIEPEVGQYTIDAVGLAGDALGG